MTTGCLHQLKIIAGESPHGPSVATIVQLFPRYAPVVCWINREAATVALNATGQDGINMETLYQASKKQTLHMCMGVLLMFLILPLSFS